MTMQGFDIANVNGPGIIDRALTGDFVICKASEGLNFVDNCHDRFVSRLRAAGKLVGHYHYAHVANSPTSEAQRFLLAANARPGDVLVLDFEPYGQTVQDSQFAGWIVTFCQYVTTATGAPCWLYANDDMLSRAVSSGAQSDCDAMRTLPLWKARYASGPGNLHGWTALTAWQSSDQGGIDVNTFYGDAARWASVAVPGAGAPATTPTSAPAVPAPPVQEDPLFTDGSQAQLDDTQSKANAAYVQSAQALAEVRNVAAQIAALQATVSAEKGLSPDDMKKVISDAIASQVKVTGTLSVEPTPPKP